MRGPRVRALALKRAQHVLERSAAVLARNDLVRDRVEHSRWEWRLRRLRAVQGPVSADPATDEVLRRLLGPEDGGSSSASDGSQQVAQGHPGAAVVGVDVGVRRARHDQRQAAPPVAGVGDR